MVVQRLACWLLVVVVPIRWVSVLEPVFDRIHRLPVVMAHQRHLSGLQLPVVMALRRHPSGR